MKYFIGYLIEGEVKKYQEKLIDRICEKFDVRNLNGFIPAHFTLKSPFETEDITPIENSLEELFSEEKKSRVTIDGIGNFHKRVIYLKGNFSLEALQTFRKLNDGLKKIDWMQFDKYDLIEDSFHTTLARVRNGLKFDDVMKFLDNEKPHFELSFDNVSIFQKTKDKWVVYRKFELG